MHVLQISETLPDRRVEKTIRSDIKLGNKVSYIGLRVDDSLKTPNYHELSLTLKTALYRVRKFKQKLKELVLEVDPDIIHAHDILLSHAALDLGYPVVYNDHEFHSKKEWIANPLATPWTRIFMGRKITWPYRYLTYRRWESELFKKAIVIVANENVAKEHRKKGATTFIMPNYPEKLEGKKVWDRALRSEREYDGVYIGNDMTRKSPPYRQAHQAYQLLKNKWQIIIIGDRTLKSNQNILSTGYIPHEMIYDYTMRSWTGLLAWKPHQFHPYCSPNKYYFYIHSGAVPIVPKTLEIPIFDLSLKFKAIHQIPELISYAKKHIDPAEVIEKAKDFIWERNEPQLKCAYEQAFSL